MLKKIAIGFVVLLALAAGGFWYLFSNLDSFVKSAIQTYGSQATQSTVSVGSVDIALTSGQGTISGITIGNPAGFGAGNAVSVAAITVQIDPSTVPGSGPIVIKLVNISQPEVNYEVGQGGSNLQTIQHNVQAYAGGGSSGAAPSNASASSPQRKQIISDLTIDSGEVTASSPLLPGRELRVPLPLIHLTNLGQSSGGATAAQIGGQVLSAITAKATQAGSAAITKGISGAALKGLGGAAGGVGGGKLKGLFGG
ncbi:MAG: hypothetical protein POG74_07895 [Acidocella sp.]|nr:hypothetical protein [Acidocella sp.]